MTQHVQAVYQNGVLRPLRPLDLDEDQIVEIDVRDVVKHSDSPSEKADKIAVFEEWMASRDQNTPILTDEQISRESMYEDQIRKQF